MHVQSMKAKHELQLINTVKQLLEKQGEYEKNFHKQNEKFETQQTLINTFSSKFEDVKMKNVELAGKVDILGGRLNEVEKKDVELVGKVEIIEKI